MWHVMLAQLQSIDVTTAAGTFALLSMHAHTYWQTLTIKKHVDREIDAKIGQHTQERHP